MWRVHPECQTKLLIQVYLLFNKKKMILESSNVSIWSLKSIRFIVPEQNKVTFYLQYRQDYIGRDQRTMSLFSKLTRGWVVISCKTIRYCLSGRGQNNILSFCTRGGLLRHYHGKGIFETKLSFLLDDVFSLPFVKADLEQTKINETLKKGLAIKKKCI